MATGGHCRGHRHLLAEAGICTPGWHLPLDTGRDSGLGQAPQQGWVQALARMHTHGRSALFRGNLPLPPHLTQAGTLCGQAGARRPPQALALTQAGTLVWGKHPSQTGSWDNQGQAGTRGITLAPTPGPWLPLPGKDTSGRG